MNCGPMAGRSGSTTSSSRRWIAELTNSILPEAVCSPSKPTVSPGRGPQSGVSRLRPSANQRMGMGDGSEDVVVRLALAERLDALLLENDDAVVGLRVVVGDVARAVAELADVPALEVGAGGQDDVGELGLALHPDRLVDDRADPTLAVRLHIAVGLLH